MPFVLIATPCNMSADYLYRFILRLSAHDCIPLFALIRYALPHSLLVPVTDRSCWYCGNPKNEMPLVHLPALKLSSSTPSAINSIFALGQNTTSSASTSDFEL